MKALNVEEAGASGTRAGELHVAPPSCEDVRTRSFAVQPDRKRLAAPLSQASHSLSRIGPVAVDTGAAQCSPSVERATSTCDEPGASVSVEISQALCTAS